MPILEEDIEDKEKKEFRKRLLKKIENKEIDIGKQSIENTIQEINHSELMYKGTGIVRNLFFDKDGYLNPNKERVKQIFKAYEDEEIQARNLIELKKKKEAKLQTKKRKARIKLC